MNGPAARTWSRISAGVLVSVAVVFILNVVANELPWINHDVAFNFASGRKIATGQEMYVDWIDNNPPAIYLYSALLSAIAGARPHLEIVLYIAALLVAGAAGIAWIRSFPDSDQGSLQRAALLAAHAYVITGASISVFELGQREHLFMVLFVPWLAARLADRPLSPRLAGWALVLGYFATMKPHFVAMLILLELTLLFLRRCLPLVVMAMLAAGGMVPFAALWLRSPESFTAFFTELVPYILGPGSPDYSEPLPAFLSAPGPLTHLLSLAALAGVLLSWYRRRLGRSHALVLAGLVVLANLVVLEQHRFYVYHFFIPAGVAVAALAYVAAAWLAGLDEDRKAREARAWSCLVLALITANLVDLGRCCLVNEPPAETAIGELLQGRHQRVLFISTSVEHVNCYYHFGIEPVGPWAFHFQLPGIYHESDPVLRQEKLQRYASRLAVQITAQAPTAVVFSPNNQALQPFHRYSWPAIYPVLAPLLPLDQFEMSIYYHRGYWIVLEKPP